MNDDNFQMLARSNEVKTPPAKEKTEDYTEKDKDK